jgi:hypothetical protein
MRWPNSGRSQRNPSSGAEWLLGRIDGAGVYARGRPNFEGGGEVLLQNGSRKAEWNKSHGKPRLICKDNIEVNILDLADCVFLWVDMTIWKMHPAPCLWGYFEYGQEGAVSLCRVPVAHTWFSEMFLLNVTAS